MLIQVFITTEQLMDLEFILTGQISVQQVTPENYLKKKYFTVSISAPKHCSS